jgi:hypothetical protein
MYICKFLCGLCVCMCVKMYFCITQNIVFLEHRVYLCVYIYICTHQNIHLHTSGAAVTKCDISSWHHVVRGRIWASQSQAFYYSGLSCQEHQVLSNTYMRRYIHTYMYVCTYIYIRIYKYIRTKTWIYTPLSGQEHQVRMPMCMCMCMRDVICIYKSKPIYIYIYIYMYVCICINVCMYVCMYV